MTTATATSTRKTLKFSVFFVYYGILWRFCLHISRKITTFAAD